MKNIRGYIFSRPFMGERVPQHVQNLVIRDYCNRNHLQYLLSATEYAIEGCHIVFTQVLIELPKLDGIAIYSLFQLPEDANLRREIYNTIISFGKELHFAVEGLKATNWKDLDRIEVMWNVRQTLPSCPTILNF